MFWQRISASYFICMRSRVCWNKILSCFACFGTMPLHYYKRQRGQGIPPLVNDKNILKHGRIKMNLYTLRRNRSHHCISSQSDRIFQLSGLIKFREGPSVQMPQKILSQQLSGQWIWEYQHWTILTAISTAQWTDCFWECRKLMLLHWTSVHKELEWQEYLIFFN